MSELNVPTISCMMLTYNRDGDEYDWAAKTFVPALHSFLKQTYPISKLQLVVVNSGSESYKQCIRLWLESTCLGIQYDYKLIETEKDVIGNLRNLALNECTGDFVAVWDDDDISHPDRLKYQIDYMFKHKVDACMVQNFDIRFVGNSIHVPEVVDGYLQFGLDASITYINPKGDLIYPSEMICEDTIFINGLCDIGYKVCAVSTPDNLYTYTFHGSNTMSLEHIEAMIRK